MGETLILNLSNAKQYRSIDYSFEDDRWTNDFVRALQKGKKAGEKRHQRRTVDEQTLKTSGKFSIGRHITPESLPALSLRFPIFTKAARNESSADHNYHFLFFFFSNTPLTNKNGFLLIISLSFSFYFS